VNRERTLAQGGEKGLSHRKKANSDPEVRRVICLRRKGGKTSTKFRGRFPKKEAIARGSGSKAKGFKDLGKSEREAIAGERFSIALRNTTRPAALRSEATGDRKGKALSQDQGRGFSSEKVPCRVANAYRHAFVSEKNQSRRH